MMSLTYTILQWTPIPGVYQPLPRWQIQQAEIQLKMNKLFFYEQAVVVWNRETYSDALYFYHFEHAQAIVAYWSKLYPFANYLLVGGVMAQHTGIHTN